MKKTLLFISLFTFGASFAQNCSEIFISEYVEGSGNDKAIELYNPTSNTINLSGYTLERHSNGDADATNGGTLALVGTIAPFTTFVVVNGQTTTSGSSPAVTLALQQMADQLDGVYPAPTYMNGNDAILLKKNGVMIDIFGRSGDAAMASSQSWSDVSPYDGSAGAWWTKDHSLQRKATVKQGVTVNPNPFIVTLEWDSLPKDTWTNLGSHTCDCELGLNEKTLDNQFNVYPNPSSNFMYLESKMSFNTISIVNLVGEVVYTKNLADTKLTKINLESLEKGIYFIKIQNSNSLISNKQIIVQ